MTHFRGVGRISVRSAILYTFTNANGKSHLKHIYYYDFLLKHEIERNKIILFERGTISLVVHLVVNVEQETVISW